MAEKNGFDFYWVSHDMFKRSSLVMLAAVAARTEKLKIGNTILNPYSLNPAELTTFIATLDELSGGRAVIGISSGGMAPLEWVGIKPRRPYTGTLEAIDIIRKLLAGEVVPYQGKEFNGWTDQCYLRFKPYRNKVPVYLGGSGEKMLAAGGRIAEGVLPILFPPEFADLAVARIKKGAQEASRDISEIDIAGCVWFSISKDGAMADDPLKELVAYFGYMLHNDALNTIGLSHDDFEPIKNEWTEKGIDSAKNLVTDKMLRLGISGGPDECISKIEDLEKRGITQVVIGSPLGPNPEEAIKLIGAKVIPYFKDQEK